MQGNSRTLTQSAAALAKVVALALVLAVVFSAGRIVVALFVVDTTRDRTAQDAAITELAYQHATSHAAWSAMPEQPDPL